jgi:hypothetical protein
MSDGSDIVNCLESAAAMAADSKFGQGASENVPLDPGETEPPVADPVSSASERAQGLLRGFCLVLEHHNAPAAVQDSCRNQVLAYLSRDGDAPLTESAFVKRAKYITCAPMSWYLKNGCEPLKKPPVAWKPTGQFRNWLRPRLRSRSTRNTHLFYSWLQAKRAALPLTEEMVHTAYEEHRVAMGLPDPIDDDTHDGVMRQLEPVLTEVCTELLSTYQPATLEEHLAYYGDIEGDTRHVASTRACFEKSRTNGGQLGALMEKAFTRDGQLRPRMNFDLELARISYHTQCVVGGVVTNNALFEHYRKPVAERAWNDSVNGEAFFYHGQALKATIQVVLEPLKTRVISKGESTPYYLSKPLQTKIHDILRHRGEFRLVGRPLSATDLMDLEQNRVMGGVGGHEWFSIDYSAATDGLSARLSASIMERILRGQRSDLLPIWMSVLAPHLCRYPFPHDDVLPIQQVNGQLMGSILSFPILCLANLGLYLHAISDDPRPLKQKLQGVLVNGDDMLYVARRSRWATHVALGEKVGLKMSPGKAYHDRVFANANSACFHFPLLDENRRGTFISGQYQEKSYTPKAIPFLNAGLYFGQNKVMNKVSETGSEVQSRVSVIEELLRGCRAGVHSRLREIYAGYIKRHKKDLYEETGDRNLFISRGLGGMGLTPHPDLEFKITNPQRRLAFRLYHESRYGHIGYGPLPGPELQEAPITLKVPWQPVLKEDDVVPKNIRRFLTGPMLSKLSCLQPFRLCAVARKRGSTVVYSKAREGFQPSLLDQERRERWYDQLTFDEPGLYGTQVDEYHSWLDAGTDVCYVGFDVLRPWLGSEEWEPITASVQRDLALPSVLSKETILLEERLEEAREASEAKAFLKDARKLAKSLDARV